jgi:hypothetical protein
MQHQVENAINGLLAGQLTQLEDEELLDELNGIMSGMGIDFDDVASTKSTAGSQPQLDLPEVPSSVPLPPAPTHEINSRIEEQEREREGVLA